MNDSIKAYLVSAYNRLAYTHNYVFGYCQRGMVYAAMVKDARELLPFVTVLDKASQKNGGTFSLKYKPNKAMVDIINSNAERIFPVMSENMLEELKATTNHNRGQIFEDAVAEMLKAEQPKQKNAKFTDSGDIILDGTHYQVKYNKATFTDERTIKNLGGQ
jgi:hypothetical protein